MPSSCKKCVAQWPSASRLACPAGSIKDDPVFAILGSVLPVMLTQTCALQRAVSFNGHRIHSRLDWLIVRVVCCSAALGMAAISAAMLPLKQQAQLLRRRNSAVKEGLALPAAPKTLTCQRHLCTAARTACIIQCCTWCIIQCCTWCKSNRQTVCSKCTYEMFWAGNCLQAAHIPPEAENMSLGDAALVHARIAKALLAVIANSVSSKETQQQRCMHSGSQSTRNCLASQGYPAI
jgi:hypothetical protein